MSSDKLCAFIIVIVACLHPITATESYRCFQANAGLSSGCSIPLFDIFPYKNAFTPSCQRHDICYGCASKFSKSRLYCDNLFLQDMLNVCNRMSFLKKAGCKYFARSVYYNAVRVGGFLLFKRTPKTECNQDWVPSCFP
ncbi:uncharacterized protein LOC143048876 [Mytilus galloprovincialis]|uniref:uncharacterized protein LOC143048876 n=1 Tax=Mytilus galloprovincialis TaxID=29158 RepID=UPI003F7C8F83